MTYLQHKFEDEGPQEFWVYECGECGEVILKPRKWINPTGYTECRCGREMEAGDVLLLNIAIKEEITK